MPLIDTLSGASARSYGLFGSAAAVSGDFENIATVTIGSGGSASVSFTSIPSTYKHLQVRAIAKSATTANGPSLYFNGSASGSAYSWHFMGSQADGVRNTNGYSSQAYISGGNILSSTEFGIYIWDVLDYQNTNKYKNVRWLSGLDTNGSSNSYSSTWVGSGLWQNTAAITQLDLFNGYGWSQYSSFALYGIKG